MFQTASFHTPVCLKISYFNITLQAREEQAAIEQQEWVQLQAAQAAQAATTASQGGILQQQQQPPQAEQASVAGVPTPGLVTPQQAHVPPEGPS